MNLLVKLATRPGKVYQHDLTNEIETLSTINRELPDSRHFPVVYDHGHRKDGRVYLVTTFFEELPLVVSIGTEWVPQRLVTHLRTALEVAKAVGELHSVQIFHVDLNPMNILHRVEKGRPIVRIVDFESSYDVARHSKRRVLQSADDHRILRTRSLTADAECAGRRLFAGRRGLHDAGGLSLGGKRRAAHPHRSGPQS